MKQENNNRLISTHRNLTIDALRGLAIFTMVAANTAGNILIQPHPFWFRFYGTFAAPMFIFLSGLMVAKTRSKNISRGLTYYMRRGLLLLLMASIVDSLVWNNLPFMTFDVLYLIGVANPIAYLVSRWPQNPQWLIALFILLITPVIQQLLDYRCDVQEVPFTLSSIVNVVHHLTDIGRRFVIDGWFPLFPWLGFSLLGVAFFSYWQTSLPDFSNKMKLPSLILLILGIIIWIKFPGPISTRSGYSELFYPATWGYMLTTIGIILMGFCYVPKVTHLQCCKPFIYLGRCSLFIYLLHCAIIRYVLIPSFGRVPFLSFIMIYLIFVSFLICVAYGIHRFKEIRTTQSNLLIFLIGR